MTVENKGFFIGIIGTGPIGLECGLQALEHGYRFLLFESGDDIASHVHLWSHVRLFTPFEMNRSALGRRLLYLEDDNKAFLTGGEYIERYLRPVSHLFQENIRLRHRVISVGRYNSEQFIILVDNGLTSKEEYFIVHCVIDASGTYSSPNFVGPGHLPAVNERNIRSTMSSLITPHIPNGEHQALAGKRIVLIGKGHSAATSALTLGRYRCD